MNHLPIAGRKIRFAVVGCGRIAANHFAALARDARNAELVAVCDTDRRRSTSGVRTGARVTRV